MNNKDIEKSVQNFEPPKRNPKFDREQRRERIRRFFVIAMLMILITGIGGIDLFLIYTQPSSNYADLFEYDLGYSETITFEQISDFDPELEVATYSQNDDHWKEEWPQLSRNLEQVELIGLWLQQNDDGKKSEEILDRLSYFASYEPTSTAINTLKLDVYLVLKNYQRYVMPEHESKLQSILNDFNFDGRAYYYPHQEYLSVLGIQLHSRSDQTNIIQRDAEFFLRRYEVYSQAIPPISFFDWSEQNMFFLELDNDDEKNVVYASSWDVVSGYGLPTPSWSNNDGFQDGEFVHEGITFWLGEEYRKQAEDIRFRYIFDEVIKKNWSHILETSQRYKVDPFILATVIFNEQTDIKDSVLSSEFNRTVSRELEGRSGIATSIYDIFVGGPYRENYTDFGGGLLGHDVSTGLTQISISVANTQNLISLFGRRSNSMTPSWLSTILLQSDRVAIDGSGLYIRQVINTLLDIQNNQENLYWMDVGALQPDLVQIGNQDYYFNSPIISDTTYNPLVATEFVPSLLDIWYTSPPPGVVNDSWLIETPLHLQRMWTHQRSDWGRNARTLYMYIIGHADELGDEAVVIRNEILNTINPNLGE